MEKAAFNLVFEGGHDLGRGFSKPRDQHEPNHEGGNIGQCQVFRQRCSTDMYTILWKKRDETDLDGAKSGML